MHAWIRRALCAVGITGGIVLLGFGLAEAASADSPNGPVTSGQSGILSGNQTGVDVQAPVNASGNQITVIGQRNHSTSVSGSATHPAGSGSPTTTGQNGIGSGNQTGVAVHAPVNATGNQVTVIGQDNTSHALGASSAGGGSNATAGHPTTSGQNGIGSGNQTAIGVQAPINLSGNQITVIGQDNTNQSVSGTSTGAGSGGGAASGSPTTTGQGGILSGNQTGIALALPINISGNQVTVIGQDNTLSSLGGSATPSTGGGSGGSPTTSGENGIGSGNQTGIGVQAPVNVSGNQVTVIGQDNTNTAVGGSATPSTGGSGGSPTTSGENAILSGNQTGISVAVPIAATGNQVTVIGQDNTNTSVGGSSAGGGGTSTGGGTTTGAGGIGSGNQTPIDVQVPVDTSGNQVTVIGQDNTNTSTSGSTSGGTPGGTTPPGGGVVSPPGGTVSPPAGGSTPHGSTPSASGLPSTGLAGDTLWLGLLGLLLLGLGGALIRRTSVRVPVS